MKIGYSAQANNTAAFALIAEGWNELVQAGLTPDGRGFCPVDRADHVLYAARDDGEVIGVLCYRELQPTGECLVSLVYVEPTSRRQGVCRLLFASLEARVKSSLLSRIRGTVHVDNVGMQEVLKRLGKPVVGLMYETHIAM